MPLRHFKCQFDGSAIGIAGCKLHTVHAIVVDPIQGAIREVFAALALFRARGAREGTLRSHSIRGDACRAHNRQPTGEIGLT